MINTAKMSDKDYEILTKNIHQALLKADGHDTIEIQHDVKIEGRSKQKHQIDVYWKFSIGGVTYQTAIECKRYKSSISVGRVRDFFGALEDIGNINGVMVTTHGYESGAEAYAASKGIRLLIIRSPTDADLSGLLRTIIIQSIAAFKNVVGRDIRLTDEWIAANSVRLTGTNFQIGGMNNEIGLHSSDGAMVKSWWQIENELPVVDDAGVPLTSNVLLQHSVDVAGLFILIPEVGLVPLKSVTLTYEIHRAQHDSRIEVSIDGMYVIKNDTGERQFFDAITGALKMSPLPQE